MISVYRAKKWVFVNYLLILADVEFFFADFIKNTIS